MIARHSILLVSAVPAAGQALARRLGLYEEFSVVTANSAAAAWSVLAAGGPAAILLDGPLGTLDETGFCQEARRCATRQPIIVLGSGSESEIVRTLQAGAIDYVAAPVRINLLVARLRAHLRAFERSEAASLPMGRFLLRLAERRLCDLQRGCDIHLTQREVDLVKYLHRVGARTISQRQLLAEVWNYEPSVDTHTVQTHVYRLRRKLGGKSEADALIVTDGDGYRLAASADPRRSAA
jgi:DNA-binding response OmpR family regulator